MSVSGKRKQLKEGIIRILSEWLLLEYKGDYDEVAADIMALVPKPEKCVMYKILTPVNIMYFQCSKCDGVQFDIPDKFCPHCGRRIIAMEDMSLWL